MALKPVELFFYCPRCGSPATQRAQSPFQCTNCDLTYFFNPTVAAGVFLFDPEGRVLFIRRAKEPAKDKLAIPGGFIDMGETAEQGLRREVLEEVGLEFCQLQFLGSWANEYLYREVIYPVVDLIFTAQAIEPARAQALDGVAGLAWLHLRQIEPSDLAFHSVRSAWHQLIER